MSEIPRRISRRLSRVPSSLQCADPGLSQYYYSRRISRKVSTNDLPMEENSIGMWSPWAALWFCCFMVAPIAYIYILLMLLRDLCLYFPEAVHQPLLTYAPTLARLANKMNNASRVTDVWCIIEALFFIICNLKIQYLQRKDPLEASLSAAPMLDPEDRRLLWERVVDAEKDDPTAFISGWFFDKPISEISRYDVYDFICWSMFDGRNQEHLTTEELHELECFLDDCEYRISLHLYGAQQENDPKQDPTDFGTDPENDSEMGTQSSPPSAPHRASSGDDESYSFSSDFSSMSQRRPRPAKMFRFSVDTQREEPTFFSNLYESYKERYERYKTMIENAEFHPVQDFRNRLAETAQQAEESAMATAQNMYATIVAPGSNMDKHLAAWSLATTTQLTEAWNSVKGMKDRLKTATFLAERRTSLLEQLRGNRAMLTRMREMSYAVPSKQMAALMRKITELYDALEVLEVRAREGFEQATGAMKARGSAIATRQEQHNYARYSSDPLLGIKTYPLGFHLLVLGATEIPLRVMLKNRGFERRCVGPVNYYHHPGTPDESGQKGKKVPIVFVHGIGIGNIAYFQLIEGFLNTGRPVLLPEIPYVSGFRPWQSSNSMLSPAVVASTLTAMLATHGYSKGTFAGHSYGTSWLSCMCKYAPSTVAALLFLDPICFCLHYPRLTTNFVYHRADPGSVGFMVRTDMIVNWTIQRAFPWTWIILFVEQIHVPCTIFLSDKDALVPAERVERYLRAKNVPVCDGESANEQFFSENGNLNACVFRGHLHGAFTEEPSLLPPIVTACNSLCERVEGKEES